MCSDYGIDEIEDIDVDDDCGSGTSELDLYAEDYVTLISNATVLLDTNGVNNFTIPEDEIDEVCEVGG